MLCWRVRAAVAAEFDELQPLYLAGAMLTRTRPTATDLAGLVRGDGPDDDRVVCSDVVAAGRFCSGVPSRAADPTVPCAIM